jgi:hypothetical protein
MSGERAAQNSDQGDNRKTLKGLAITRGGTRHDLQLAGSRAIYADGGGADGRRRRGVSTQLRLGDNAGIGHGVNLRASSHRCLCFESR